MPKRSPKIEKVKAKRKGRPGAIAVPDVARGTAHVEIAELPRR